MSFDSHLIHTCKIERPYEEQTNAHGLADDRHREIAASQACRLVVKQERIGTSQSAERPLITTYTLLLPANADIQKNDRITEITLEDRTAVTDTFHVEAILPRRGRSLHHISVMLEKVA